MNKANDNFKNIERSIWIHAAKLEETNDNGAKCEMIIQRGIKKISKKKILIKREDWLEEAFGCEKGCSLETAKAIIRSIMQLDMPDKDFEKQWLEDSENAIQREYTVCAKAILEFAL